MPTPSYVHEICNRCWEALNPGKKPIRLSHRTTETCCYCGTLNASGIYVREEPDNLPCKGEHS